MSIDYRWTIHRYPERFAQPGHRAWVLCLYLRKCCQPASWWTEGVVIRCSCSLFLGHLVWTFLLDLFCLLCKQTAKIVPESGQSYPKMILEVTWELHGEPLVPKTRPATKKALSLIFSSHPGTVFGTFSAGNMEKIHLFFPFFEASLIKAHS